MTKSKLSRVSGIAASLALVSSFGLMVGQAQAAATIVINNLNGPGVGFNDTTAAAPVGGKIGRAHV